MGYKKKEMIKEMFKIALGYLFDFLEGALATVIIIMMFAWFFSIGGLVFIQEGVFGIIFCITGWVICFYILISNIYREAKNKFGK